MLSNFVENVVPPIRFESHLSARQLAMVLAAALQHSLVRKSTPGVASRHKDTPLKFRATVLHRPIAGLESDCARCVSREDGLRSIWPSTWAWTESFISDLENGKKEICIRNLDVIAVAFELTVSKLLARL